MVGIDDSAALLLTVITEEACEVFPLVPERQLVKSPLNSKSTASFIVMYPLKGIILMVEYKI